MSPMSAVWFVLFLCQMNYNQNEHLSVHIKLAFEKDFFLFKSKNKKIDLNEHCRHFSEKLLESFG